MKHGHVAAQGGIAREYVRGSHDMINAMPHPVTPCVYGLLNSKKPNA
jgi:hypothetical protein